MILFLFKRWWNSAMQRLRAIQEDLKFHGLNLLLGCSPPPPLTSATFLGDSVPPPSLNSETQRLARGSVESTASLPSPNGSLYSWISGQSLWENSHTNRSRVSREDNQAPWALKSFPAALGRANIAMKDLLWEWAKPQSTNTVLLVDLFQPTSM